MKEKLGDIQLCWINVPVILGGAAYSLFVHEDCQNTYKGSVLTAKMPFSDLHSWIKSDAC